MLCTTKWNNTIGQSLLLHSSKPLMSPSNQCFLYIVRLSCVFVFMKLKEAAELCSCACSWNILEIQDDKILLEVLNQCYVIICIILGWFSNWIICFSMEKVVNVMLKCGQPVVLWVSSKFLFKEALRFCRFVFVVFLGFFYNLEARYFEIIIHVFFENRDWKAAT